MKTKRAREGYVMIDHRNSPGITPDFLHKNRIDAPAVGAGVVFESAIAVCHCCGGDVILNPDRSRARDWCSVHDAYRCDNCAAAIRAGAVCTTIEQKMLKMFDEATRGRAAQA